MDYYSTRTDSSLMQKIEKDNSIVYRYYSDFYDTSNYYDYEILDDNSLVFSKCDTFQVIEILKLNVKSDSIEIFKYEDDDQIPGGFGCWIFCRDFGMMGNGLYVGEKMIISKFDQDSFKSDEIVELMSYRKNRSAPRPTKEILEALEIDYEDE